MHVVVEQPVERLSLTGRGDALHAATVRGAFHQLGQRDTRREGGDAVAAALRGERGVDPKNRSYPVAVRAGGGVGRANWPTILRQM